MVRPASRAVTRAWAAGSAGRRAWGPPAGFAVGREQFQADPGGVGAPLRQRGPDRLDQAPGPAQVEPGVVVGFGAEEFQQLRQPPGVDAAREQRGPCVSWERALRTKNRST
ncbi:hypothetical protein NKH77_09675 [Streptomyces sp. M19]